MIFPALLTRDLTKNIHLNDSSDSIGIFANKIMIAFLIDTARHPPLFVLAIKIV